MSTVTPTTKQVREGFARSDYPPEVLEARLDRWLAVHDADLVERIAQAIEAERDHYIGNKTVTLGSDFARAFTVSAALARRGSNDREGGAS